MVFDLFDNIVISTLVFVCIDDFNLAEMTSNGFCRSFMLAIEDQCKVEMKGINKGL
jgi:hypothetical protein